MAAVLKKRALAEFTQTIQESSEPPFKKLCLTKPSISEQQPSTSSALDCLENCKTSNETLQLLLSLPDINTLEPNDVSDLVKKLSETFKNETEAAVRVKILSLLADIGLEHKTDLIVIIDEIIILLKNELSHKAIAQGIKSLLKLSLVVTDNCALHQKLLEIAKTYLKNVNQLVKCKCLEMIGSLISPNSNMDSSVILKLVCFYFNNEDARVRSQAFSTAMALHERGIKLDNDVYLNVCAALKDDYEIVRKVALKLICLLGISAPESLIMLPDSEQELRLIDDAFGKVCSGLMDLSMNVRTIAATLLGKMTLVNYHFLNQTLDKKLMSNMRRKRTAHELAWENVTSGEWASGKKWADDAPREIVDVDNISLISSGACGAFVHGLEDEFLEVRSATVHSLRQLSINNPDFANLSLDFLVDMLNDEIEDVRLIAIDSLRHISAHIILRDDQLETILGALEDFSREVREGLHRMLAACKMATTVGLKMCVEKLLDNLKKYPQDKRSTFRCLQFVGKQHPELVLPLVPQFLCIHPYFDAPEPDIDNPQYVCMLILILNAAKHSPTIKPLLEPHTLRHYDYLRDTMPNFVPELSPTTTNSNITVRSSASESLAFIKTVVDGLLFSQNSSYRIQMSAMQTAIKDLNRLSDMDSAVTGAARFTSMFADAQLLLAQILDNWYWKNPARLATQWATSLKTSIQSLLECCLKMQFLFIGLGQIEICNIKQLQIRALALNLTFVVRGSNASALILCQHFLASVKELQKLLQANNLESDSFTASLFKELSILEEPKPGSVATILLKILNNVQLGKIPAPNLSIKTSSALIIEPVEQTDSTLKFTAGLAMAVPFDAELYNIADRSRLRLKIKYPDQRTQISLPRPAHIKPLLLDNLESEEANNYRLLTTVLISSQHVWSEACNVEISIALAVPEANIDKYKSTTETCLVDLCKPVKISVAPKPIKKTL